jgi:hypothetical protein
MGLLSWGEMTVERRWWTIGRAIWLFGTFLAGAGGKKGVLLQSQMKKRN